MTQKQRMDNESQDKILVRDLNVVITCRLCEGYLIDATTLVDCFHVFCRGCILRYFENNKTGCPTCNTVYKKKTQACFRPDPQIQALVYKLVPSLYAKEMQRREDFYRSTGVRASSSCSDDSVIERERDMINDHEEMISTYVGDKTLFLSPEDSISLSLEYYQLHLDTTDMKGNKTRASTPVKTLSESDIKITDISENTIRDNDETQTSLSENTDSKSDKDKECAKQTDTEKNVVDNATDSDKNLKQDKECDKRFLQCPAAVLMKHLQKFVRLKYGLTGDHRVDIIYKGEVLPHNFSLMDVAYTFKWKRVKPMRFFYRIFIPMKIRPIKIVNTTLSTGGKQLQIVPVKPNMEAPKTPERREKTPEQKDKTPERKNRSPEIREEVNEEKPRETESKFLEETEDQKHNKEQLFAHLQLQSKSQVEKESKKVPDKSPHKDCVFEYEEPDQEEIKKFAEKRDREWALQKKLDEKRKVDQFGIPHVSKKRKKSKHSKNEFNLHKKRKLHAEIASNEEELKLKVKITNNGHKHKHHKSSGQVNEKSHTSSVSSKEKLLQMRQVRHKHSPEDKIIQTSPSVQVSKEANGNVEKIRINVSENTVTEKRKENGEETKPTPSKLEDIKKLKIKVTEPSTVVSESAVLPKQQTESTSTSPKVGTLLEQGSSKSVFSMRSPIESREWGKKVPNVNMERTEQSSKQAQKTFLKTFHAYAEKYYKNEKIQQTKMENAKIKQMNLNKMQQIKTDKINAANKNLERKISNSLQIAANTPKPPEKVEKKVTFVNDKPKMSTPHYPPGFTVSKIEQGVKRKVDDGDSPQDKRPSLEITLITPPSTSPIQQTQKPEKHVVKRPPPATIPLERIKKSVNLKSGISIIPKLPDMCDNIGALDLSKPSKSSDAPKAPAKIQNTNGFSITNRQINALSRLPPPAPEKSSMALSNLQMLSKVATEHSTLNNKTPGQNNVTQNKPRPQMPNLQTLKIPSLPIRPNLQKIPKLNEINKFRPTNPQIRNLRPNQNQNIRNIPNPSLLNQNRLNSQISIHSNSDSSIAKSTPSVTVTSSQSVQKETATMTAVKSIIESKVQETKEISV